MINTQIKSIEQEVTIDIICDGCGISCITKETLPFFSSEYATLKANWGYFSNSDGEKLDKQFCFSCTKLMQWLLEKYFEENKNANKTLIKHLLEKDMNE